MLIGEEKLSRYSLFKRGKVFYEQIKNPETGKYFSARPTGQSDETEALLVVSDWLKNGLPEKENLHQIYHRCRGLCCLNQTSNLQLSPLF